jgi:hypothetical protein
MNSTLAPRDVGTPWPSTTSTNKNPAEEILNYLKQYAREKPDVAAMWIFGIGFVLGWKLKPW